MTAGKKIILSKTLILFKSPVSPQLYKCTSNWSPEKALSLFDVLTKPILFGTEASGDKPLWAWALMATSPPEPWAGSALSSCCSGVPSSPGGHTGGVPSVLGAPRAGGHRGSSADALAEGFTLAPLFLLGCPVPAQCSEIHWFHCCLGCTLVAFQTLLKQSQGLSFPENSHFALWPEWWCQSRVFRISKFPATK